MGQYQLTFDASAIFTSVTPQLDVIINGQVVSSLSISAQLGNNVDSFVLDLEYDGGLPPYVSFRFNDGSSESGRSVSISNITVNGQGANLLPFILQNSETKEVSVTNALEKQTPAEPIPSDIEGTAYADSLVGTNNNDTIRGLGLDCYGSITIFIIKISSFMA